MIDFSLNVSTVLLWCVVLILLVMVIALARQVGILFERIAPMGALVTDSGPALGSRAPTFDLQTLASVPIQIPVGRSSSTLLFFLSPTCPVCKKLLPVLKSVQHAERSWLNVVLASDGNMPDHLSFWKSAGLTDFPYVLSSELGMAYRVARLPYAVLIDENGILRSKGLINSREQLESLFIAKDLGVASVQEYLSKTTDQHDHAGHDHAHDPVVAHAE